MSEPLCRFLEWDSEFFGYRIFRVVPAALDRNAAQACVDRCRDEDGDCLYYLANADDADSLRAVQSAGFRLVDLRVTLTWERRHERPIEPDVAIRTAREDDLPQLERIAESAHRDTRFYVDPRFLERAPALYRTWIANEVRDDRATVFVTDHDGLAAGYLTARVTEAEGHIGLVGVAEQARGRGIGRALLDRSLGWFVDRGCAKVHVPTHGRNLAAQRLYQRSGFLTSNVQLWFHRWLDDEAAAQAR
jgi:ribosomal protein S18 acetylase RimI-like enzyme